MNRESSIQGYVGKDSSGLNKRVAKELLDKQFKTQEEMDSIKDREKTPIEIEIINFVNEATNKLLADYGIESFDVPLKNVHIIEKQDWKDKHLAGGHVPLYQSIEIREHSQKIVMASLLFHEMLHFKSYNSVELKNGKIEPLRTGLKTHTRPEGKPIFTFLNEAVVSELQKRFVATLDDNPLFKDETERTKAIIAKSKTLQEMEGLYYAEEGRDSTTFITADSGFYKEQRRISMLLMEKIKQKNSENFANTEEVFTMFVKGLFSSNLLQIGKLIDKSFGTGTYRKIADLGNDLKNLREYIEKL
ncbi:MAG: hypothetical protein WCI76_00315 [bacterium]